MEGYFVLVAFAIGFLVAQIWKTLMGVILDKKSGKTISLGEVVKHFASSGGMPSGHTASFTGASLCVGTIYGFGSGIFALAVCVWAIVVYDATHVRYAVGEQGKAIKKGWRCRASSCEWAYRTAGDSWCIIGCCCVDDCDVDYKVLRES